MDVQITKRKIWSVSSGCVSGMWAPPVPHGWSQQVPTPSTRENRRPLLLTMRLGLGVACDGTQRDLQARIDRQQVITSRYEAGHMLLQPEVFALQLVQAIKQRGNCD